MPRDFVKGAVAPVEKCWTIDYYLYYNVNIDIIRIISQFESSLR